jgi:BirA family biotin operon repressor/biotin-[acetyl-CoA-carboxylase] ligase
LKDHSNILTKKNVLKGLSTTFIGKKVFHFFDVTSTNWIAKQLASQFRDVHGAIVVSETQSGGKGRYNRPWMSFMGGLWFSIILRPSMSPSDSPHLTHAAGIAVTKCIRTYGLDARIKWPNDVLIHGKKVCGILTEISTTLDMLDYAVVGIGVNVNIDTSSFPEDIRENATAMRHELGKPIDRVKLLQEILVEFEETYKKLEKGYNILDEWKSLSDTIGREVVVKTVHKTIEGVATGIDSKGALVVKTDKGMERILSGECIYARHYARRS